MALSREEDQRLDRLTGSGKGWGGGLPLPHLFAAILKELVDNGGASDARLVEIATSEFGFKQNQVFSVWSTWAEFAADVLAQMEARGVVRRDNSGLWQTGDKFALGRRLEIVPSRSRNGSLLPSDGVTVWDAEERKRRDAESALTHELTAAVALLRPDGNGLRPVDVAHARSIRESIAEVGQLYPVLVDQHGHILDGKHRKAADPGWKAVEVRVDSEEMAVAVALWANSGKPLPPKVKARVEELVLGAKTVQEKKKERIRQALLDSSTLTHNAIAKRLDVHHTAVNRECEALIAHCAISTCEHRITESGRRATGPKPKDKPPAEPKKPSKVTPELEQEVRELLEEGKSVPRRPLARKHNVSEGTVGEVHRAQRKILESEARRAAQSSDTGVAPGEDESRASKSVPLSESSDPVEEPGSAGDEDARETETKAELPDEQRIIELRGGIARLEGERAGARKELAELMEKIAGLDARLRDARGELAGLLARRKEG